jgi:PKD repeat protein
MDWLIRRTSRWLVVVFAFCATMVAATPAGAVIVQEPDGTRVSVAVRSDVDPASIPGSMAADVQPFDTGGNVSWNGGPVMHGVTNYSLFWDPGNLFTTATKNLINQYFTDLAADSGTNGNTFSVLQQYGDGTGYLRYKQTYGGELDDATAYPASGCTHGAITGATHCLSNAQLVSELGSYVTAHSLPRGLSTEYFIFTPTNVVTCTSSNVCSDNTYCAYHSFSGSGATQLVYADDPFTFEYDPVNHAGSIKGCQFDGNSAIQEPNGDLADVVLKAVGHESRESLSDPHLDAWFDIHGNELDDKCNAIGTTLGHDPNAFLPTLGGDAGSGTLFNQVYNGHDYYMQSEWSNGAGACLMSPGAGTISPAFVPPPPVGAGNPSNFAGTATSTNPIFTYSWDFGDGAVAEGQNVSHTYATSASHNATLTVVDVLGNTASVTYPVPAGPPVAAFTPAPASAPTGSAIAFNSSASTSHPGTAITTRDWDFGDGSAHGSGASPTHAYGKPGTYTVSLTVTDNNSLTAATTHQVTVTNRAPTAAFASTPAAGVAGGAVAFDASASSDPDGTVASYDWSFGDGTAHAAGAHASHTFKAVGTYNVTLAVKDDSGASGTVSHGLVVVTNPFSVSLKGSTLTVKLGAASRVTVTVARRAAGRKTAGGKCVKATHALRKRPRCDLPVHGSLSFAAPAGTSKHRFSGRIGGHKLKRGSYVLTATAVGAAPVTIKFKISH